MEKEKGKKTGMRKFISIFGRVAFVLAIMFLISYLVTILTESGTFFRDSSGRTALVQFEKDIEKANELAETHYTELYTIADQIQDKQSREEVSDHLSQYIGSDQFGLLRFYAEGQAYDVQGGFVSEETYGGAEIAALVEEYKPGCSAIYHDGQNGFDCMAFFVPVQGSYVQGLLSIMKVHVWTEGEVEKNVPLIDTRQLLTGDLLAAILVDENGKVYGASTSKEVAYPVGNDLRKFIGNLSTDPQAELSMQAAIDKRSKEVCHVKSVDGDYVFTVAPVEKLGGNLFLVTMSEREGLIAPEMKYIRYIINLTVISILSLTIGMIYAFCYYRDSKHALEKASSLDPIVGCANAEYFRLLTEKALQDKQRKFAVMAFEIRQFRYLEETLSVEETTDVLKFISKVMDTFCNPRETYGYFGEGRFGVLLIDANEKTIRDRVRLIETVLIKNPAFNGVKTKKLFNVGVGIAGDVQQQSAQELISHANAACQSAKNNVNLPYVIYNEQVNMQRVNNDRIELEMESALANDEFRLFLQPKYNIAADRIDSAEALVRWFDPRTGDYRFPGEFISLFESNGFITKLDHYMYLEVLKYLQTSTERGEKQVPISVNVSLVTANQSDFLNFYIDNKKKYGVADDFITIEFTESFLMEDHQKLHNIVERLHRNGIRCSLDDFGTGYASFSLLKDVSFDELKLDRTLLNSGINEKQDDMVLGTIVQLAKSLGMRVVQEGVETKAMFDKVVDSGCTVIQGYYYAKAIPVEEYKLFLGSNTSIKYKSLVK